MCFFQQPPITGWQRPNNLAQWKCGEGDNAIVDSYHARVGKGPHRAADSPALHLKPQARSQRHPFVRHHSPTRNTEVPLTSAQLRCCPRAFQFNFRPDLMTKALYWCLPLPRFPTRRHQLDSGLCFADGRNRLRQPLPRCRAVPRRRPADPQQRPAEASRCRWPPQLLSRHLSPGSARCRRRAGSGRGAASPAAAARRRWVPAGVEGTLAGGRRRGAAQRVCGGGVAQLPAPSFAPSDGRGAAAGGSGEPRGAATRAAAGMRRGSRRRGGRWAAALGAHTDGARGAGGSGLSPEEERRDGMCWGCSRSGRAARRTRGSAAPVAGVGGGARPFRRGRRERAGARWRWAQCGDCGLVRWWLLRPAPERNRSIRSGEGRGRGYVTASAQRDAPVSAPARRLDCRSPEWRYFSLPCRTI